MTGNNYAAYGQAKVKIGIIPMDWDEYDVGWHNATSSVNWQNSGGDYSEIIFEQDEDWNTQGRTYSFDVTKGVQHFVDNPSENFGLLLISENITSMQYTFKSKEHSDTQDRPKLEITYNNQVSTLPDKQVQTIALTQLDKKVTVTGLASSEYKVSLYNSKGVVLESTTKTITDGTLTSSLNYSPGVYVLQIGGGTLAYTKKIILP